MKRVLAIVALLATCEMSAALTKQQQEDAKKAAEKSFLTTTMEFPGNLIKDYIFEIDCLKNKPLAQFMTVAAIAIAAWEGGKYAYVNYVAAPQTDDGDLDLS